MTVKSKAEARVVVDDFAALGGVRQRERRFGNRRVAQQFGHDKAIRGIVQWSGDEPMNKYEIAVRLAEALRLDARLTPQSTPTDTTPRPHNCHLASSRLEALGIGRRTPFDTAIREVLTAFPWRGEAPA